MLIATDRATGEIVTGPDAHTATHTRTAENTSSEAPRHTRSDTTPAMHRQQHRDDAPVVRADGGVTRTPSTPSNTADAAVTPSPHHAAVEHTDHRYACSICGEAVTLTAPGNVTEQFDYFHHVDGTRDCSATDATGATHREAIELVMQRLSTIVGDPGLVEPETRVEGSDRFLTVDVHAASQHSPVAVEIFTAASHMHLRRRLSTLFDAGYTVFIVVATTGRYSPTRVEQYLQRVSSVPVRVGRFAPRGEAGGQGEGRVSLGTQLSRHVVDVDAIRTPTVPAYMA